jgi:hypothetical protein
MVESRRVPSSTVEYRRVPSSTVEYRRVPPSTVEYRRARGSAHAIGMQTRLGPPARPALNRAVSRPAMHAQAAPAALSRPRAAASRSKPRAPYDAERMREERRRGPARVSTQQRSGKDALKTLRALLLLMGPYGTAGGPLECTQGSEYERRSPLGVCRCRPGANGLTHHRRIVVDRCRLHPSPMHFRQGFKHTRISMRRRARKGRA